MSGYSYDGNVVIGLSFSATIKHTCNIQTCVTHYHIEKKGRITSSVRDVWLIRK